MDATITAINRDPGDEASTNDLHNQLKNVIINTASNLAPAAKGAGTAGLTMNVSLRWNGRMPHTE